METSSPKDIDLRRFWAAVAVIFAICFGIYQWNPAKGGESNKAESSQEYVPLNSEGKPAVGPIPAPPDDPCWKQTARAAQLSPEDGGQSLMPQRCIDKGF